MTLHHISKPVRDWKGRAGILRTCAQCGGEFVAAQEYSTFKRKFCSQACAGANHRERAIASYPSREEVIRLYVDEGFTDRDLGRRFGRSYNWALKVRQHYNIPGRPSGTNTKPAKSLRARFGIHLKPAEHCRNCGLTGQLHLHHAVPRSLSPQGKFDLRNGVQLCTNCHLGWHHRRIRIYRDIFTAEEWAFISTLIGPVWLEERYPVRPDDGGAIDVGFCKNGHPWTTRNTYITPEGRRVCRACSRERARRYRAEESAA